VKPVLNGTWTGWNPVFRRKEEIVPVFILGRTLAFFSLYEYLVLPKCYVGCIYEEKIRAEANEQYHFIMTVYKNITAFLKLFGRHHMHKHNSLDQNIITSSVQHHYIFLENCYRCQVK